MCVCVCVCERVRERERERRERERRDIIYNGQRTRANNKWVSLLPYN